MSPRSLLPALAVLFVLNPLFAQFTERIDVSAIEVPVVVRDAKGNVPAGLTPADFILLEDGKPQQIIGVAYPVMPVASAPSATNVAPSATSVPESSAEKRWQVVIYIQQSLSSSHGLSEALKSMVPHAGELTALGDVQIVGDEGGRPHVIASATHDPEVLRRTLLDLVQKIRGQDQINLLRKQYLAEARLPIDQTPLGSSTNSIKVTPAIALHGLATARIEALIVRDRQDAMMTWTARYQEPGRRHALLFVTGGYDLEPIDFYGSSDNSTDTDLRTLSSSSLQTEIAQAMAAGGWTVIGFAPGWMDNASSPTFDVTNPGRDRMRDFLSNPAGSIPTLAGLDIHPLDPLRRLAEETGGSVQTDGRKLAIDIDQLANRLVITYQLRRPRDGRAHNIEVKSLRPGVTARAQRVVVSGTPETLSLARATLLAGDEGEHGELTVRCTVRPLGASKGNEINSQLDAEVSLAPIDAVRAGITAGTLRFSVSVRTKDAPPVTISRRMEPLDLSKQANWRIDFQVRHNPGATIGLVAEELATGAWGGSRCGDGPVPAAAAESAPAPSSAPASESPRTVSGRWKTIAEAMAEAQAKNALILLDLRTSNIEDRKNYQWIAEAEAAPSSGRVMSQMVLAWADERTHFDNLPDLAQLHGWKRQLFVLDPWGGVVLEPEGGFGDVAKFGYSLNALRQQTPEFIQAAMARREGKVAQSLVLWGDGLLGAGVLAPAGTAYRQAYEVAKQNNEPDMMQRAQIGTASLDLSQPASRQQAVGVLQKIVEHPATNEISSQAWLLLGNVYQEQRSTKLAVDAYQKSFAAAPKPSPLAEASKRYLEALGSEPESELRADAAGNVHLLYPHREVMVDSVVFGIATSNDAARVDVFLDDARVAELTRRPFSMKINLGPTPHVRTVRAVAFDAQERRIGEESVTLNDRAVSLGINIVAPASDSVASKTTVEMQPRVPQGTHLAGVDLYWNETKVATMTEAPFRYELVLPSPSASGFIRAVVRAADGATAEDVKMINAGGSSESVRVDAVRVYAIVQDRAGHYIDGLKAPDFVVKEDGRPVTPRVQSASDDPVSIGLALDTSGSMRVAMTSVIDYANEFVQHSLGPADQTFVTAFDEQPRLVQPLTANRKQLTEAIYDMQANGGTAIWDAILYSLQQFHDVPGKRALVVFTDGINNAGSATAKADLQYAREVGVPVYVVQIFTGRHINLEMTQDEKNIKNLTESTGGAFFRFAAKKDLPRIFSQIRDDTRGQYLLTYVSPETKPNGELRRISVEVPGKPLMVRATSGYYAR
ncbi:MAG TPA: VWA domain-containing protein [Thermoanaerobaculia bacterium]|nr:VWA domain-containing protein [Thermoanaerobaculia bacterium]